MVAKNILSRQTNLSVPRSLRRESGNTDTSWKISTVEYGCLVGLHIKEQEEEAEEGGTDEQHLSDKPSLIRYGEIYST